MSLEKIQSGQPMRIKADTFNSIIDATRAYKERQQSGGRAAIRENSDSNIVLVKNDSGADAERFGVLGIDGPIILPSENLSEFENRVTFACSTPTAGTHEGKFVVLAEPIAAGAIGRALALGVTPVQINVTAEAHRFADIASADTAKLKSAPDGAAQILWKESGTGTKWALVRLGGVKKYFYAELTDEGEDENEGSYSWKEVYADGVDVTSGRTGTKSTATAAEELNGATGVEIGTIVKLYTETDSNGAIVYRFEVGGSSLPAPELYKPLVGISDGEGGVEWGVDYLRFVGA